MNLKLFVFFIIAIIAPNILWAQSNCKNSNPTNPPAGLACSSTIELLKNKGFTCEGQVCKGHLKSYPEPVIIMVPIQYKAKGNVHYHFHGHNSGLNFEENVHFDKKSGVGDYLKFAEDAKFASLLVFPTSLGKCSTFDSKILKVSDLEKINSELAEIIGTPLNKWSLSFHSGADRTANRLLSDPEIDKKLTGVALFDSLYAQRTGIKSALQRWESKADKPSFQSYYVANAGTKSPAEYNQWLKSGIKRSDFFAVPGASHMGIMKDGRMSNFFRSMNSK